MLRGLAIVVDDGGPHLQALPLESLPATAALRFRAPRSIRTQPRATGRAPRRLTSAPHLGASPRRLSLLNPPRCPAPRQRHSSRSSPRGVSPSLSPSSRASSGLTRRARPWSCSMRAASPRRMAPARMWPAHRDAALSRHTTRGRAKAAPPVHQPNVCVIEIQARGVIGE